MSKSVNVDFVTRQIEVDTDGKEHFISAAMAAKDAEQSMFSAQNAAKEVKEIYGDGNFTPLSDLLGGLGTKLKRWGAIFANKVFASNLPIVYNNVAEMKADTMLWEGMNTKTLGYYEPNDGGGASYLIRTKADTDVADGGSLHELQNGLVAELIIENGTVNVKQFGAVGDGVSDNATIFENISNFNIQKFYPFIIEKGIFATSKTVNWYGELRMGTTARIKALNSMDVLFKLNPTVQENTPKKNMNCFINVDCNALAETGIAVLYVRQSNLNLLAENTLTYGIVADFIDSGNDENIFNCRVKGTGDLTKSIYGVTAGADNHFQTVMCQDVKHGFTGAGVYHIGEIHCWGSTDDYKISETSCIKSTNYTQYNIGLLVQDCCKYGIDLTNGGNAIFNIGCYRAIANTKAELDNMYIDSEISVAQKAGEIIIGSFTAEDMATYSRGLFPNITNVGGQFKVRIQSVQNYTGANQPTDCDLLPAEGTFMMEKTGLNVPTTKYEVLVLCKADTYLLRQMAIDTQNNMYIRSKFTWDSAWGKWYKFTGTIVS